MNPLLSARRRIPLHGEEDDNWASGPRSAYALHVSAKPWIAISFWLIVAGCGDGCGAPPEPSTTATSSSPTSVASAGQEGTGQEEVENATPPGPPPVGRLHTVLERRSRLERRVKLQLENRGRESYEFSADLGLEFSAGGEDSWEAIGSSAKLRFDCQAPQARCITLTPGAVFIAPPWSPEAPEACAQCGRCDGRPAELNSGTYRFVARSCDGAHRLEGESFEL